jgi:exosortase/archaeosortase family protein
MKSSYIDLRYFFRFGAVIISLYYFHIFYLGITSSEGGLYSFFLDHYFNYISWLRSSILYVSNFLTHTVGLNSWIEGTQIIRTPEVSIEVWLPCLGLNIMSFWVAFIIAHNDSWKNKLAWCLTGCLAIWVLNCFRISLLLIALEKNWESNKNIDHHTLFNLVAYTITLFLIYFYLRSKNKSAVSIVFN